MKKEYKFISFSPFSSLLPRTPATPFTYLWSRMKVVANKNWELAPREMGVKRRDLRPGKKVFPSASSTRYKSLFAHEGRAVRTTRKTFRSDRLLSVFGPPTERKVSLSLSLSLRPSLLCLSYFFFSISSFPSSFRVTARPLPPPPIICDVTITAQS